VSSAGNAATDGQTAPDSALVGIGSLGSSETWLERWHKSGEAREEGFRRAILGRNSPEIAYREGGKW
jgi:hypothetical protein